MWLDSVKKQYKGNLEIIWKNFSLEQVNSKEGPDWKVWDQPDEYEGKGIWALRAGEAARKQGKENFERFHIALLKARHEERRSINQIEVLEDVAVKSGLDAEAFRRDLRDRSLLENIANDHTQAVEEYGVFGTPTFIFEDGLATYLKIFIPPEEESISLFGHLVDIMAHRRYFGELKRPQPPWPKGVFT